jgi:beta-lactam-binding protein with PASTA domain
MELKYIIIVGLILLVLLLVVLRKKIGPYLRFMFTGIFIINFVIGLIVAGIAFWGLLAYLDSYTLHGEEIAVPNFYGMNVDELGDFTSEKNLRYKIVDSIYSDESPRGTVISQLPSAHSDGVESYVKPDRTIYLTIVKTGIEYKTVPSIVDQSKDYAVSMLKINGLTASIKPVAGKHANLVYAASYNGKDISEGMRVPKGSSIQLNVGLGTAGQPTSVPSLRCSTIIEAKSKLSTYKLFLDYHCDDCLTAADTLNAKIYKQVPGPVGLANTTVREGADLTVFASVAKPCDGAPLPVNADSTTLREPGSN